MAERITQAEFDAVVMEPSGGFKFQVSRLAHPLNFNPPTAPMEPMKAKLRAASGLWGKDYKIDVTLYDKVYITSDIHADVRKLIDLLQNEGLIRFEGAVDGKIDVNTDAIYTSLDTVRWIQDRTLLILVGDLIDGRRGASIADETGAVNDSRGYFELLLHAYLYNLRVSAKRNTSEVLFTLGNHEYVNLFDNRGPAGIRDWLSLYTHAPAKRFFGSTSNLAIDDTSYANRKQSLLPFYEVSPYFMLLLKNGETDEVACIHAGLHTNSNYVKPQLIQIQDNIQGLDYSTTSLAQHITEKHLDDPAYVDADGVRNSLYFSGGFGGLNDRKYAQQDSCNVIKSSDPQLMIVVGHCPTSSKGDWGINYEFLESEFEKRDATGQNIYEGCAAVSRSTNKGCVVVGCQDAHGPQLAFVDVGMSAAFRAADNSTRNAEFLLLERKTGNTETKNPAEPLTTEPRHYNVVSRKPAGMPKIIMWEQTGGGPGPGPGVPFSSSSSSAVASGAPPPGPSGLPLPLATPPQTPIQISTPGAPAPGAPFTDAEQLAIIAPALPVVASYIMTTPGLSTPTSSMKQSVINNTRFIQKPTVEGLPMILAMLPALATYISTTEPRKDSRAYSLLNRGTSAIGNAVMNAASSLLARVTGKASPKPTAITGKLLRETGEWKLGGDSISKQIKNLPQPDMARLATLKLPSKPIDTLPSHIPRWVPPSVVAELNFDPQCNVGGAAGPTCLPTTMYKHIEELDAYNKSRSFSNGKLWASERNTFDAMRADPSREREFKATYPLQYPFIVKDASGTVPEIVPVFSPYYKRTDRAAGTFEASNLVALAKIAPPEMIYSETNKSDDVKAMSIALLESLAFCGTKKTLDDPDCEPLRILAELREFHAGQKAAKAHYQTEESKRLSGPWGPIQRILNLIAEYAPAGPAAPGTAAIPGTAVPGIVPTPAAAPSIMPPKPSAPSIMPPPVAKPSTAIPFIIPPPFSTAVKYRFRLPGLLGAARI
jgi:hypothetical protein